MGLVEGETTKQLILKSERSDIFPPDHQKGYYSFPRIIAGAIKIVRMFSQTQRGTKNEEEVSSYMVVVMLTKGRQPGFRRAQPGEDG